MTSCANRERRRESLKKGEEELEILVARDYEVRQMSEYHFRINGRLDVWPSTRKWYDLRSRRKGSYKSLAALAKEHLKA
jgi:hypothetical protein